jgi:hypothetical protein
MLVAAQFPYSPIWKMIDDVKATSSTRLHGKIFTKNTIEPNIVTAIYIVLKQDKNSLLSLPMWEQLYILRVLCILCPKSKYNLIGFGELKDQGDGDDKPSAGKKRKGKSNNLGGEEEGEEEYDDEERREKKRSAAKKSNKKTVVSTKSNVTEDYGGVGVGIGVRDTGKGVSKKKKNPLSAKGKCILVRLIIIYKNYLLLFIMIISHK